LQGLATDAIMAARLLRCAIEDVPGLHPNLFVEPHMVAFVAVAEHYSRSPALFDVECGNVRSRWLGKADGFRLEVSWQDDTAEKAEGSGANFGLTASGIDSRPLCFRPLFSAGVRAGGGRPDADADAGGGEVLTGLCANGPQRPGVIP
jgi:hypothetical protein